MQFYFYYHPRLIIDFYEIWNLLITGATIHEGSSFLFAIYHLVSIISFKRASQSFGKPIWLTLILYSIINPLSFSNQEDVGFIFLKIICNTTK